MSLLFNSKLISVNEINEHSPFSFKVENDLREPGCSSDSEEQTKLSTELLENLVYPVYPDKFGKYNLLDNIEEFGEVKKYCDTVQCNIYSDISPQKAMMIAVTFHIKQKTPTQMEKAKMMCQLKNNGFTSEQIKDLFGCSKRWIDRSIKGYKLFNKLSGKFKDDYLQLNKFSLKHFVIIAEKTNEQLTDEDYIKIIEEAIALNCNVDGLEEYLTAEYSNGSSDITESEPEPKYDYQESQKEAEKVYEKEADEENTISEIMKKSYQFKVECPGITRITTYNNGNCKILIEGIALDDSIVENLRVIAEKIQKQAGGEK